MGVFELDEQNVMSTATTERGQACGVARQHAVSRKTACKTPNHHFGAEVADGDEDACDRDHSELSGSSQNSQTARCHRRPGRARTCRNKLVNNLLIHKVTVT